MSSLVKESSDPLQVPLLRDQVRFLTSIPQPLSHRFVKVHHDTVRIHSDFVSYEMEALKNHTTLHELIFSTSYSYDPSDAKETVCKVLDFALKGLFSYGQERSATSILRKTVFDRAYERLAQTDSILALMLTRTNEPVSREYMLFLQKLLASDIFECNGRRLTNVKGCLGELLNHSSVLASIEPLFLGTIHGDLHTGNIMVNPRDPNDFVLIDRRGFPTPMDIAYDLGKMWHSFDGLYDFILDDHFELEQLSLERLGVRYKVETEPQYRKRTIGGGGSLSSLSSVSPDFDSRASATFSKILSDLPSVVGTYPMFQEDTRWLERTLLMEAMHFCTMLPFHMDKSIRRAIVLYVRGVELLNDFVQGLRTRY